MAGNADFRLLQFENYESYLTSFIRTEDYRYLSSMDPVRRLVRLGYRSTARVYEEAEFNKIRAKMMEFMNPKVLSSVHYSDYFKGTDAALAALMRREEPNLLRQLSVSPYIYICIYCILVYRSTRLGPDYHLSAGASAQWLRYIGLHWLSEKSARLYLSEARSYQLASRVRGPWATEAEANRSELLRLAQGHR